MIEIMLIVDLVIFGVMGLVAFILLVWSWFIWHKHKSVDDTQLTVKAIHKELQELINEKLKKGLNE